MEEEEYFVVNKSVEEVEIQDQIRVGGLIYDVTGIEVEGTVYRFSVECLSSTEGQYEIELDDEEYVEQIFS